MLIIYMPALVCSPGVDKRAFRQNGVFEHVHRRWLKITGVGLSLQYIRFASPQFKAQKSRNINNAAAQYYF